MAKLIALLGGAAGGGILLLLMTLAALLVANSPLGPTYDALIQTPAVVAIGDYGIEKPLVLWINDGLMALFFFLVGLELKREFLEGELRQPNNMLLPLAGSFGGMAAPALIYSLINWGDATALRGWAIPSATDIAFTLAIVTLFGKHLPLSLRTFLLTLAIYDDIGAILIIALFYTQDLSATMLMPAGLMLFLLTVLNRRGIANIVPYALLGTLLWLSLLKSGIHATLAGILVAMFIPMSTPRARHSPLRRLENDLQPTVNYAVLPLFAFANTGINFEQVSLDMLIHPITVGTALGLVGGNLIGITSMVWLCVKLGLARLPPGIGWWQLIGIALLCGVGFTMSLFIASLAFENTPASNLSRLFDERLGILIGSTAAALLGSLVLYLSRIKKSPDDKPQGTPP